MNVKMVTTLVILFRRCAKISPLDSSANAESDTERTDQKDRPVCLFVARAVSGVSAFSLTIACVTSDMLERTVPFSVNVMGIPIVLVLTNSTFAWNVTTTQW